MKYTTEEKSVISTEQTEAEASSNTSTAASKDSPLVEKESESESDLSAKLSLPTLAEQPTYLDALSYVKELKKVRSTWESTLSKASNDALYLILAECLNLLMNPEMYDIESSIRRCIEDECKNGMKKVQKNTTIEAKIVRVVFDNMYNRRRVHSYSVVLQEAKRQKVTPESLADWIKLYGGIQEIRVNAKPAHQQVKIPRPKTKLTEEQQEQLKAKQEEQLRISLESFDRLVESGVFCVGDSDQDVSSDTADTNAESTSLVQETASEKSSDELATSNSDAQSEPSHQKSASIDKPCEETLEQSEPKSSQDEMLVCIAYRLANGKYDVKWELQDEDVRDLAIAAYRMEKHGVYSEYDAVKSMMQSRATTASIH
jgi:hypothetical protein